MSSNYSLMNLKRVSAGKRDLIRELPHSFQISIIDMFWPITNWHKNTFCSAFLVLSSPFCPLLIAVRFSFEWRKVVGFAFATLHDWLKKIAPIFHPIRSKTKINRDSLARVFPRFVSATCNYFEFWLVHCIACSLWLARVITLVLVSRH